MWRVVVSLPRHFVSVFYSGRHSLDILLVGVPLALAVVAAAWSAGPVLVL